MENFVELTATESTDIEGGNVALGVQVAVTVTVWAVTTYYNAKAAYEYFF